MAAAIEILDDVLGGSAAEQTIAAWARRHRFAGSSDRSAIRDIVYDALRRRRSLAAWGGSETGRGLMLGSLLLAERSPDTVFGAGRHAPSPLTADERNTPHGPWPEAFALDCPDFALPLLKRSLGARATAVMSLMKRRADVHVRANLRRTSRANLLDRLARDGIEALGHPLSTAAIVVTRGARRLRSTAEYAEGLFELQDAASQAVADEIPVAPGSRVLDFCAGAGGKTLAMAARVDAEWFVHDAIESRMKDLPERAMRAGCNPRILAPGSVAENAPYDVVLADVPCSGSGTWRRDPEAKWNLTRDRLDGFVRQQAEILDTAADLVAPDGVLAYATCSLFKEENDWQVDAFRRRGRSWKLVRSMSLTPLEGGDGFYLALLSR